MICCDLDRAEIVEGAKHMWRTKVCALCTTTERGVDLDAPILPAPSPLKMIMKDED